MPTTITLSGRTKKRLAGYKHGDMTYDDLLNVLMDRVKVEDVSLQHIEEHYKALAENDWISASSFAKQLQKRMKAKR